MEPEDEENVTDPQVYETLLDASAKVIVDDDNISQYDHLIDNAYMFSDGDSITIIQLKRRDTGIWVTFNIQQGPGIPRKQVMHIDEFTELFGHLFPMI